MTIDYVVWGFYLSIIGVILAIFIPFVYVQYTIKLQFRDSYNTALNKLLAEMKGNYRKMHNFHNDFTDVSSRWRDRNNLADAWLPKAPSFGLHRFVLHYLPSKAYYNFMNRGYFSRLKDGRLEHLMEFYSRCILFSENTTLLEISINQLDKNSANFETELNILIQRILLEYTSAMNGFDYHYEGEHGFNPENLEGLIIAHWYDV
jgi:hypothetical protein